MGQRRPIRAKTGHSSIFKEPVSGPVWVGESGLAGDHIADTRYHGGPSQAVYVFTRPDHAAWEAVLGRALPPGTFGENLLLSDLESAPLRVGQTLRLGAAMLELTAPRIPCVTLAVRMGDPDFVHTFREMKRPGFSCRVLREGWLEAGQDADLGPEPPPYAPSVLKQFVTAFGGS